MFPAIEINYSTSLLDLRESPCPQNVWPIYDTKYQEK